MTDQLKETKPNVELNKDQQMATLMHILEHFKEYNNEDKETIMAVMDMLHEKIHKNDINLIKYEPYKLEYN
jgi:hypothetical protein